MPIVTTYPYDPTGENPANLIENEVHVLSPPTEARYAHYIIPSYAPFFGNSLVIKHDVNGTWIDLVEGEDYHLAYPVSEAQEALGILLYGAILFIDRSLDGNVSLDYQTIGDRFAQNDTLALRNVFSLMAELTYYTWDMVIGQPFNYVPDYHLHDESDQTMQDVVNSLTAILALLGAGNMSGEAIKPGMVMMTTTNFVDAAQVAAFMGYGVWIRVSVGRYPVGAGSSTDSDGNTLVVNGGQQFGVKEVVQNESQVANHVHPVHLNGPGGDPVRNFSSWKTDASGNYASTSDTGVWADNLLAFPRIEKFGNRTTFGTSTLLGAPSPVQPMTNLPPSEGFYYWKRLS